MEKTSKKVNVLKIVLFIVIAIITILLVSGSIILADGSPTTSMKNSTFFTYLEAGDGDITSWALARAIRYNKTEFMKFDSKDIFSLNTYTIRASGWKNYPDIAFKTALCLYHRQSTIEEEIYKIVNIIDINKDNMNELVIYNPNNTYNVSVQDSKPINVMAKLISKTMSQNLKQETFQATKTDENGNEVKAYDKDGKAIMLTEDVGENGEAITTGPYKGAITYYWHNNFINIVKGKIDSSFINDTKANGYSIEEEDNGKAKEILAEADIYANNVSQYKELQKISTTPKIEYKDEYAYIGPLKVTFEGASQSHFLVNNFAAKIAVKKSNDSGEYYEFIETVPSGTEFYAVVERSSIENIEDINITFGVRYTYISARMILISSPTAKGQNLAMYADSVKDETKEVSWQTNNEKEYGNLQINKIDSNGTDTVLEGVEFKISNDNGYIQLSNASGAKIGRIIGTVNISKTNTAIDNDTKTEYKINYVSSEDDATIFVTDSKGQIIINNLDVSKNDTKLTYTIKETAAKPGYILFEKEVKVNLEKDKTTYVTNLKGVTTEVGYFTNTEKDFGNLQINKVDSQNQSVALEGVEFKISSNSENILYNKYIQLLDTNGTVVEKIVGKVTISKANTATETSTETEYKINYVNNIDSATTFVTDSKGQIIINNLEVNKDSKLIGGNKIIYTIIETTPKDGYSLIGEVNVELETKKTTYVTNIGGTVEEGNLTNQPLYTELGGYVWLDTPPDAKGADVDNKYTSDSNDKLVEGVKVELVDKTNNSVVKETQTDENGRYKFTDVSVAKLADYYVRFEYDGLTYTSVVKNIDLVNGSKAVEVLAERTNLNNKYDMISGEVSIDNTMHAVTEPNEVNIRTLFDNNSEMMSNINLGLRLREQPDNSISEDIQSVVVRLNGYEYTYNYATRDKYINEQDENKNAFNVGVKFGNQYTNKYTRALYTSDIKAVAENRAKLEVSVIYKVTIKNEATTLKSKVSSIVNYYDKNYDIEAVGKTLEGSTIKDNVASMVNLSYNNEFLNQAIISCDIDLEPGAMASLYIKYSIKDETVVGLLNNSETLYNASEILSYTTYYGANTYEGANIEAGNIYAGIDEDSTPNNANITVVEDSNKLDVKTASGEYEDDVDIAPSLLLQAEGARTLSGIVWEDSTTYDENNGRLGNGEYATNENVISGVKVELIDVKTGEIAKYSNGTDAVVTSQADGTYRFGINDRDNNNYIGILPGNYVIRYTYSNDCEIKNTNGDVIRKVNVNDYKSTIVKSDKVKEAINAQDISEENQNNEVYRWYIGEETRYSDALDNINLRSESNNMVINNSTVSALATQMQANTPALHIPVEYTTTDVALAMYYDSEGNLQSQVFVSENRNIDFGIAERAKLDVSVDKKITSLEIKTSTGNVLVQGDPSDANAKMQYVRTGLDGLVPAEISSEVLQGAEVIVGYTITLKNNSELDYDLDITNQESIEYYYYGIKSRTLQAKSLTINKVVDYLSGGMQVTSEIKTISANELKEAGLISEEVSNTLSNGKYVISIIEDVGELSIGESKQIQLSASKALASSSEDLSYTNYVEILEYTGRGRTLKDTTPGNYDPEDPQTKEDDGDLIELIITDPTGKSINYTIYIGVIALTLVIVAIGTVIIKKKVIKS